MSRQLKSKNGRVEGVASSASSTTGNRRPPVIDVAIAAGLLSNRLLKKSKPDRTWFSARPAVTPFQRLLTSHSEVGLDRRASRGFFQQPANVVDRKSGRCAAFTLVELMAVVVIICVLVAAVVGTAKYANRQMAVTRAKSQMAALQMALEAYRADVGYYPASTIVRYSGSGNAELSNSWLLCRALTQPKTYYKASQLDIGIGSILNVTTNQVSVPVLTVTYFKDPWGRPWNYYRPNSSQAASLAVSNIVGAWPVGPFQASYAVGGQMNPLTFDLFSFGPDGCTYIPNSTSGAYCWRWYGDQTQPQHAIDDINNWGGR